MSDPGPPPSPPHAGEPRQWAAPLDPGPPPPPPPHAVRCLKHEGRRSVWLVQRPGEPPITLKIWPLDWLTAIKLFLGQSQVQRQARSSMRVLQMGLPVAAPIGRWRIETFNGYRAIMLEMQYIPGITAMQFLAEQTLTPATMRSLSREIAKIVVTVASHSYTHRDLRLENLIIDTTSTTNAVKLIDLVGLRRRRRRGVATARMLERLAAQPVEMGVNIPRPMWFTVLRHVTRAASKSQRRQIFQTLRQWKKHGLTTTGNI